ncbi:hypothetical protein [Falsiroseomonas sp. HW251]|uniref:hypothetical protein n=1 Tax=Falsiroseomonas sp. HW251 TaxID=3390998 RepID=UPI003D3111E3
MRALAAALSVALLAAPALAQTRAPDRSGSEARSPGPPVDLGPRTPEANEAHRGGGAVLTGPPGMPAPPALPTPAHDPTVVVTQPPPPVVVVTPR